MYLKSTIYSFVPIVYNYAMKVIALIADIIDLKDIPDRKDFQNELAACLDEINKASQTIVSPYTITLGDGFQAVYDAGDEIIDHILHILVKFFPVQVRFSISYDALYTDINRERAIGMDGPVFHAAREGMNELKPTRYSIVRVSGCAGDRSEILNTGMRLVFSIMSGWKKDTLRMFYDLYQGKKVKDILHDYNLSQRGVYKLISRNKIREFVDYFNGVRMELEKLKG